MTRGGTGTLDVDWAVVHARLESLRISGDAPHMPDPDMRQRLLGRRATELARPLASNEGVQTIEILAFHCGDQVYGLAVEQMDVVIQIPILAIPGLGGLHRGIVNHRGTIITVVDVGMLLGRPPADISERTATIVVSVDDRRLGLIADDVLGISQLPATDIHPTQAGEESYAQGSIIGFTPDSWLILDAAYLVQDARLIVDEEVQYQDQDEEG